MGRRRFEHLVAELSVAIGQVVPRYALWLQLRELGWMPEHLTREAVIAFHDVHLARFLSDHRLVITPRAERKLRRSLRRFDSRHPTPYERMESTGTRRA